MHGLPLHFGVGNGQMANKKISYVALAKRTSGNNSCTGDGGELNLVRLRDDTQASTYRDHYR